MTKLPRVLAARQEAVQGNVNAKSASPNLSEEEKIQLARANSQSKPIKGTQLEKLKTGKKPSLETNLAPLLEAFCTALKTLTTQIHNSVASLGQVA